MAVPTEEREKILAQARDFLNRGQWDQAEFAARQALARDSKTPEALCILATIEVHKGQLETGVSHFRQCLELSPNQPLVWNALGEVLYGLGHWDDAAGAHERAFTLAPTFAAAYLNYATARAGQGRLAEAIGAYERAAHLGEAAAWNNWGVALHAAGRMAEALEVLRVACAQTKYRPQALYNLGRTANRCGRFAEAFQALSAALACEPVPAVVWNELALALHGTGRFTEALAAVNKAIALEAQGEFYNNLGIILQALERIDDAEVAYRRALGLAGAPAPRNKAPAVQGGVPVALLAGDPDSKCNLARVLQLRGELPAALALYRQALAAGANSRVHSNYLWALLYMPGVSSEVHLREARQWDQRFGRAPLPARRAAAAADPARRLRVGYVSLDLRDHVVGRNVLPLFMRHDRSLFHVTCYTDAQRADPWTQRFQEYSDQWRGIEALPDEAVAAMIQADDIDILVDLGLHTSGGRLGIFTFKPAPIQVTFAGYPGTTGLRAMDYRISDPHLDPPGASDRFYAEKTIRLTHSFWCFDPLEPTPPPGELPLSRNGYCTFGSFNNFLKVNPDVLRLWAAVLGKVPQSKLTLTCPQGQARACTLAILAAAGVTSERIAFLPGLPRHEYLAAHQTIDICLDAFPYNGHTTSLEALWMGVPVITRVGSTVVGRAGYSQLINLGLPELIAGDDAQFIAIAAALAGDCPRLAALRQTLRPRMQASPLMNADRFARDIQDAYRSMWRHWCAGAR